MTCKPRQISGNDPIAAIPKDYNRYCDRIVGNYPWSPSALFANGEDGAWLDSTTLMDIFQDSAGTVGVDGLSQFSGVINNQVRGTLFTPGGGYLETSGTLLDDCSDVSSWGLAGAGCVIEDSAEYVIDGTGSLKFSGDAGDRYATKNMTFNIGDGSPILLGFYVPFTPAGTNIGLTFYLSELENLGGPGRWITTVANITIQTGLNLIPFYPSDFGVLDGTPDFSNDIKSIRLRIDGAAGREFYIDSVRLGYKTRPKCVITFDDGFETTYTEAFSYAQTKGFNLTHAIIAAQVDGGGAITTAQLQEMEAAGDEVSLHDSQNWPALATRADISARVEAQLDAIEALGVTRPTTAAYPENDYGQESQELGQTVFSSLREAGIVSSRTSGNRICYPDRQNNYALPAFPLNNTLSLAQAKAQVDNAINYGGTVVYYGHNITGVAGSTTWTIPDWQDLLDYIKTKTDTDLIDVVTLSEWRDGLLSQVFRTGSHADQVDDTKRPEIVIDGSSVYHFDFDGVDDLLNINLESSIVATVSYVTSGGVTTLINQTVGAAYALPIGDWYACVVIDRALTIDEQLRLDNWLLNKAGLL